MNLRPPGYEQGEPGLIQPDPSPPSPFVALASASTSHPSSPVPLRPVESWSRIWSRMLTLPRREPRQPRTSGRPQRAPSWRAGSDVRHQARLVGVGRPRPSTTNAASSVPADPGARAIGRCVWQGSLGRSDRTRAWPPRMRSPSADTPRVWTQRSRAAPETPPELDRWNGLTKGPRGHANPPGAPRSAR